MAQNPLLQAMGQGSNPNNHPPAHPIKTNFLFIGNMFSGEEINEEPTFFADL